ncbi:MAG: hypothetical protein HQ557_10855 [Bacteroidetes bacterium]|nr:hypothetical protein [Bacteroidota bacterium]
MKKILPFILSFLVILASALIIGCTVSGPEKKIRQFISTRLASIREGDLEAYMKTVSTSDSYYVNEQRRWFHEMITYPFNDLQIALEAFEETGSGSGIYRATFRQTHTYAGENFDFTYDLLLKIDVNKLNVNRVIDKGYAFYQAETEHFTIYSMEDELNAEVLSGYLEECYDIIITQFSVIPDEKLPVKMFTDRELLRQRTVPSSQWLFTGWGEPNESMKLWTGKPEITEYYALFRHELVHHVTMKIANNNIPVWFAEGLAMYFGNYDYAGENAVEAGRFLPEELLHSIFWLETYDLKSETDTQKIQSWYNTSGMMMEFLVTVYGREAVVGILENLGSFPFNDNIENPDYYALCSQRLEESILEVVGRRSEDLSLEYSAWMKETWIKN